MNPLAERVVVAGLDDRTGVAVDDGAQLRAVIDVRVVKQVPGSGTDLTCKVQMIVTGVQAKPADTVMRITYRVGGAQPVACRKDHRLVGTTSSTMIVIYNDSIHFEKLYGSNLFLITFYSISVSI